MELVAVAHPSFALDEAGLKRLAIMFDRIAFDGLSKLPPNFINTPELIETRARLTETGILYQPDIAQLKASATHDPQKTLALVLEDSNKLLKPTIGLNIEELREAREDEVKRLDVKERIADASARFESGEIDPLEMFQLMQRISTNLVRLQASLMRGVENFDAYAVIAEEHSSLDYDEQRTTNHDAVKLVIDSLPVPDEQAPWEQIFEYRRDPNVQSNFVNIKNWISDFARDSLRPFEVEPKLAHLLNEFRRDLEIHRIPTTTTELATYVVTTGESRESFSGFQRAYGGPTLFWLEPRKLGLLEGESTAPGSVVAFVAQTKTMFPAE